MVPLVLRPLLEIDPDFSRWPICSSPEVQFAVAYRYHQGGGWDHGWRASKLVVDANGSFDDLSEGHRARRGRLVHREGRRIARFGPINREPWDWPRFLELLAGPGRRAALDAVVAQHHLPPLSTPEHVSGT